MGLTGEDEQQDFHKFGPKYLKRIDWSSEEHRRIVAACLVRGVYVHRKDHKKHCEESDSLGPPWWESFRFRLHRRLTDISPAYGAIFEFDHDQARSHGDLSTDRAPEFVAAFRGTQSIFDMGLDLVLTIERLQHNKRVVEATRAAEQIISQNSKDGRCNVWLAGHSLGASVATYIGATIAEEQGILLETFLFNPPYLRIDPETISHWEVKLVVEKFQKLLSKLLGGIMEESKQENNHKHLHKWMPNLYVNPDDVICKGFIKYFHNQEKFEGMKPGNLLRVRDGKHNYDLDTVGYVDQHSVYLLPSGRMTLNMTKELDERCYTFLGKHIKILLDAHSLSQWWKRDLVLKHETHIHQEKLPQNGGCE